MASKGFLHIYTGEGKGKTTASLGLALRAKSRGMRVLFVQFFKDRVPLNEINLLEQINIGTLVFDSIKSPFFHPAIDKLSLRDEANKAIEHLRNIFSAKKYDLIILDEFICFLSEGILVEEDVIHFLDSRPEDIEIVLTGRGATGRLIAMADYVTYMQNIKHPFDGGIKARKGIEI